MGVFKKFRGGYSHEAVQAEFKTISGDSAYFATVPYYKDTDGTSRNVIFMNDDATGTSARSYMKAIVNSLLPYRNLIPVPVSIGLYESALGETYDSSTTYYTLSGDTYTEADMSGYSNGDTITDSVYYYTYDVEDYSISVGTVGGTKSVSYSSSVSSKVKTITETITITNSTEADIIVKAVKFYNTVAYNRPSNVATCNVLKCAYYLNPSEYVTIPAGETGAVVVVLEFGETGA